MYRNDKNWPKLNKVTFSQFGILKVLFNLALAHPKLSINSSSIAAISHVIPSEVQRCAMEALIFLSFPHILQDSWQACFICHLLGGKWDVSQNKQLFKITHYFFKSVNVLHCKKNPKPHTYSKIVLRKRFSYFTL